MIARKYVSLTGGLKLDALNSFVQANSAKLYAIFGERYILDMRTLVRGMEIARAKASKVSGGLYPSLFEGLARVTVARPLSPHGVALTRSLRFRQAAADRAMNEILMNPQKLRQLISLGNRDIRNKEAAGFLATVGASSLAVQDEE